ncbi:MAG: hypothetical protein R6T99_02290 [Bacteroidales bacterium]
MKKFFISAVLVLFFVPVAQSQDAAMIFKTHECTWFGLDFSKVKLIGSEGFSDPFEIKDRYFEAWNQLFVSEPDKYDLGEAFMKDEVDFNLDVVEERNAMPKASELVMEGDYTLGEDDVQQMISEYNTGGKDGLGVVFIMETFNKNEQEGTMWVTFFDMNSREVLLTKRMKGKAGGFGLRNYWAKSYYNVLKDIMKKKYKEWRKTYAH